MFIMWSLQDLCGYAILTYKISIFLSLYPGIKTKNKCRIKKKCILRSLAHGHIER